MIRNILFDFDGVISESNNVKIEGFYKLFEEFGDSKAREIAHYFATHAGYSRYDIIYYFFTTLLQKSCNEDKVKNYAKKYSDIVKDEVLQCPFVKGFKEFLTLNSQNYRLFIISSSDEKDLHYICDKLNISHYFEAILGSPTKKAVNMQETLKSYQLELTESIYIGDSFNDYIAARSNGLKFIARNSNLFNFKTLHNKELIIIEDLQTINKILKEL